ncbi:sugar kinase [Rhodococcus erythropolis]|uniref:sugar kinase n=1 Tax=Rhodococcus erythropolis TaxID=1833 RepID=UPI000878DF62|nr:sugar kinase [Rhodococcus erythropolis]OFV75289.1 2-dehydro-3-deoxygluconokinase [Rhodococcus erythropolis]
MSRSADKIDDQPEVVTLGESMGLFTPTTRGYPTNGTSYELGFGGAETNVAITLSRLGTRAAWIGRVGLDSFGDLILRELRAEKVTTHAVRDKAPTGLMFKEWSPGGGLSVSYRRSGSAGSRLSPSDINPSIIEASSILHLTGITPALSNSAADAVEYAISVAEAARVPISLDLNYRQALWDPGTARPVLIDLLSHASFVFAGDDEASMVLETGPEAAPELLAEGLAALGPREVIIKRGSLGAMAYAQGAHHHVEPYPVQSLDPVGAGDAFVGAYLSEKTRGQSIRECLHTAAKVGAYACTVRGDWEGAVERRDLHAHVNADFVTR